MKYGNQNENETKTKELRREVKTSIHSLVELLFTLRRPNLMTTWISMMFLQQEAVQKEPRRKKGT